MKLIVMGVAGCGKSSLGESLAQALGANWIEGDAHHSVANHSKMARGHALTDEDRIGWLNTLAGLLAQAPGHTVMSCSALKLAYRRLLREQVPQLRFVYLAVTPQEAQRRVAARSDAHFFPSALVQSQFDALEPPTAEADVCCLDANKTPHELLQAAMHWLKKEGCA